MIGTEVKFVPVPGKEISEYSGKRNNRQIISYEQVEKYSYEK
jgi:hypothetical protein